jgi:hypothetical protein
MRWVLVHPGFRSRTGSHEQGTNLPQRRQCVLPLRRRQLSVRCVMTVSKWSCEPVPKKTLKLTCLRCSRFAPRSLFNCGIQVHCKGERRVVLAAARRRGEVFRYRFPRPGASDQTHRRTVGKERREVTETSYLTLYSFTASSLISSPSPGRSLKVTQPFTGLSGSLKITSAANQFGTRTSARHPLGTAACKCRSK